MPSERYPRFYEVSRPADLDELCSRHYTWRALVACGPSHARLTAEGIVMPLPQQLGTWRDLAGLAQNILDPLFEHFGPLRLSYCFSPPELTRSIKESYKKRGVGPQIAPDLDQHAGSELNLRGRPICDRGGVAVDLEAPAASSLALVEWVRERLPFDRIYFYGSRRPVHVSWHQRPMAIVWRMVKGPGGRLLPRQFSMSDSDDGGTK